MKAIVQLAGPMALIAAVAALGTTVSAAHQLEFESALVSTAIVVSLYVFIGNSGVISFGQMSFVAVGAFLSGILTIGAEQKSFVLPGLFPILRTAHVGTPVSLVLAALVGGVYALLVGLVLMRLSGLPAGIATFAVLGITYNLFRNWEKIGPAAQALNSVPGTSIWALGSRSTRIASTSPFRVRSRSTRVKARNVRAARRRSAIRRSSSMRREVSMAAMSPPCLGHRPPREGDTHRRNR